MSNHQLGKWAVIDIETTGLDPDYDGIIDVGYLQFEGTTLIKNYESLVRYEKPISKFITKLTGISEEQIRRAPPMHKVEPDLQELYGHHLLAHNSEFEEKFLSPIFKKVQSNLSSLDRERQESFRESYEDSLDLLSLIFPYVSSLKLEHFIREWGIREVELHRGMADAMDLLKVVLVAASLVKRDPELSMAMSDLTLRLQLDRWVFQFLKLEMNELKMISESLKFDLLAHVEIAENSSLNTLRFALQGAAKIFEEQSKNPPAKIFPLTFSGENIKNILSDEEKLKTFFPNYQKRQSQIDLSLKTGQAFKNSIHTLVQAPTGTGKTFGYMIPAFLFSMAEKEQVLISTGTKTLQAQAYGKDVPKVREMLGLTDDELKVRMLIGSSNHLCELLYREEERELSLFSSQEFEARFTWAYFSMVFFYNQRLPLDQAITRLSLPFMLVKKNPFFKSFLQDISVDFRSCTGNLCPFKKNCTYFQGLKEAKDAHVIIGNHALMFHWPKVGNRPKYIVVDEAHKIEEEGTEAFVSSVSDDLLRSALQFLTNSQGFGALFYLLSSREKERGESTPVIQSIRTFLEDAALRLKDQMDPLPEILESYFKKSPRYSEQYWNELPFIQRELHHDQLAISILNYMESISYIINGVVKFLEPHLSPFDMNSLNGEGELIAYTKVEKVYSQLMDLNSALTLLLSKPTTNEEAFSHARSMKYHESEGYLFATYPIDIGKVLHDELLIPSSSVVYTSATLANATGLQGSRGIEWALGHTYLKPERRFKSGFYLPQCFDYKNHTKVFLCDDVPPLYDGKFLDTVLTPTMELVKNLNGRSLFLFSAKTRFESAREILLKEFEGKIPIFIQGMGNDVVADFKKSESGILLGMESFGEGIDIPGEALLFVFIDKIPDLRQDLIIEERRKFFESHIGNEFSDYYLAHRTRSLHQKLGRLIRTENDYGGVIVVDSRVKGWKGKTMEKLLAQMEPYDVKREGLSKACHSILEFVRSKGLQSVSME